MLAIGERFPAAPAMELLLGPLTAGGATVQAVLTPGERATARLALDLADPGLAAPLARGRERRADAAEAQRLGSLLFEGLVSGAAGGAARGAPGAGPGA